MKNYTYCVRLLLLLWVFFISLNTNAQFVEKSLTASNGVNIGFYQYTPADYNTNTKYPLIIFLHGLGERGNGTTELSLVKKIAIPKYIDRGHPMRFYWNGKWETFLVLAPQLSKSYGSWQNFYTEEMLKYAKANLSVDQDRIFLTGLSLGGGGTWTFASSNNTNVSQLAGIAVVCGTCNMSNATHLVNNNIPVWAFHAENDGTVGASCTHNAINKINSLNPIVKPIKTTWPTGGHGIWDRSYDTAYKWQNPNVFEWFLAQNRKFAPNVLPQANAGADKEIALNETTQLEGTNSKDTDGNIVKYNWTYLTGPVKPAIAQEFNAKTAVSGFSKTGVYSFQLKVIDNRAGWAYDTVNITVTEKAPPQNNAPVANAGNDLTITLPDNSVELDGSNSSDDKAISTYQWKQVSGPNGAVIQTVNSAKTNITGLTEGEYTFELEVTDAEGLSGKDQVKVTVLPPKENLPPVAKAGSDRTIYYPKDNTALNGLHSFDPDGEITAYQWKVLYNDGNYQIAWPTVANTPFRHLGLGTFIVELTVTDNLGAIGKDTVIITVMPEPVENSVPVADAGNDQEITLPKDSTVLSGTDSFDPDGEITGYLWKKISGPAQGTIVSPAEESTVIRALTAGVYYFSLTVTDKNDAQHSDTVKVTVKEKPNTPPVAKAGNDQQIRLPVNTVTLNGASSTDSDGSITAYTWTKISGPDKFTIEEANKVSTKISGLIEGIYVFRLTVTDNKNAKSHDDVKVTVLEALNTNPIANAGPDQEIRLPKNSATLNGTKSTDSDGSISNYQWTKVSGPAIFEIANAGKATAEAKNLAVGTYVFRLTVTDNKGAKASDEVQVKVLPQINLAPVANAGQDTIISFPQGVYSLNASESFDPDGLIIKYHWKQLDGSSELIITDPNNKISEIENLLPGYYVLLLTVTDNNNAVATDTLNITVTSTLRFTNEEEASVYPNPADNNTTINISGGYTGSVFMRIFNSRGSHLKTGIIKKEQHFISYDTNLDGLQPGLYFIELSGSNFRKILKLIKR